MVFSWGDDRIIGLPRDKAIHSIFHGLTGDQLRDLTAELFESLLGICSFRAKIAYPG